MRTNNVLQKTNKNLIMLIQYIEAIIDGRNLMKKLINRKILNQDVKIILWGVILMTIVFLYLTNMYQMIQYKNYSTNSEEVIKQYFSLAPLKSCILYLIYGFLASFILRDMGNLVSCIEEEKYNLKEVFFTKVSTLIGITSASIIIVFLFKIIVYMARRQEFQSLGINGYNILIFFLLTMAISILTCGGILLSFELVKNKILAVIFVPCIEYCLFLFFGLFKMLLSNYLWPLKRLLDMIGSIVVDYFALSLTFDWRIELQPFSNQIISVVLLFIAGIILFWVDYLLFGKLKSEKVKNLFYFSWTVKIVFLMMAFIGSFSLLVILDLLVLVLSPHSFNNMNLLLNIVVIIAAIVFYRLQLKSCYIKEKE